MIKISINCFAASISFYLRVRCTKTWPYHAKLYSVKIVSIFKMDSSRVLPEFQMVFLYFLTISWSIQFIWFRFHFFCSFSFQKNSDFSWFAGWADYYKQSRKSTKVPKLCLRSCFDSGNALLRMSVFRKRKQTRVCFTVALEKLSNNIENSPFSHHGVVLLHIKQFWVWQEGSNRQILEMSASTESFSSHKHLLWTRAAQEQENYRLSWFPSTFEHKQKKISVQLSA